MECQTEKRREVRGGRWGVHASGCRGGDYDPGTVHCGELCYARGIVTVPFRGIVVVLRRMVDMMLRLCLVGTVVHLWPE